MSGDVRGTSRVADVLRQHMWADRPGQTCGCGWLANSGWMVDRTQPNRVEQHLAHVAEQIAGDETVLNEWGIRWDEQWPGLNDVSGPYITASQARDGLDGSASSGHVVWRTKTTTAWRDWPTTQPRTPAGSTEETPS